MVIIYAIWVLGAVYIFICTSIVVQSAFSLLLNTFSLFCVCYGEKVFKLSLRHLFTSLLSSIPSCIYRLCTFWFLIDRIDYNAKRVQFFPCIYWLRCYSNRFGFTVMRLSSTWFEIPEHLVKDSIAAVVHLWNGVFHWISYLAKGRDWKFFLKVLTVIIVFLLV